MFLAPDDAEIEIAKTAARFLPRAIPLDRLRGGGPSPGPAGLEWRDAMPSRETGEDVRWARAKAIADAAEPARREAGQR